MAEEPRELAGALREAGLDVLADRVSAGDYSDSKGPLVDELSERRDGAEDAGNAERVNRIDRLIEMVQSGAFDG